MARVLVIDDEKVIRMTLREFLRRDGYEVFEASNAAGAQQLLDRHDIDVVVTDIIMPRISGMELLKSIRESSPYVKVILITGEPTFETAAEAVRRGAFDYLAKPVTKDAVCKVVAAAARMKNLEDENRRHKEHLEDIVEKRTRQIRRLNDRLRQVVELTKGFALCNSIHDLGPKVLGLLARNMAVGGGSFYFQYGEQYLLIDSLDPGHQPETIVLPFSPDSILQKLVNDSRGFIVQDISKANKLRPSGWKGYQNGSLLALPCSDSTGQIRGFITLHNKTEPPFTEEDLEIGRVIISHTVDAIANIELNQKLRESEKKYRLLSEESLTGIFIHQGGKVVYINPRLVKMLDFPISDIPELLGRSLLDFVRAEDREMISDFIARRSSGETAPSQYQMGLIKKNGEIVWAEVLVSVIEHEGRPAFMGNIIDITERRRAEEEEKKLIAIINNSHEFIGIADLDGSVTYINEAGRRMVGLDSTSSVIGTSIFDYVDDEVKNRLQRDIIPAVLEYGFAGGENTLRHFQTGRLIDVEYHIFLMRLPGQEESSSLAVVMSDISERKKAEAAYRSLAENSLQGLAIYQDNRIVYANQAFAEITGYSIEEMLAASPEEIAAVIHPDDRVMVWANMEARIKGESEEPNYAYRILHKSGQERWVEIYASPTEFQGGPAVQVSYFDITDRRMAEETLRENEQRYRTLFETATDAILIGKDNIFIDCNDKALEIYGCTRQQLIGCTPDVFSPPTQPDGSDSREKSLENLTKAYNGNPQFFEWRHNRLDGTLFDAEVSLNLVEVAGEKYIQAFVRDITERKKVEEALRGSEASLRYASNMARLGSWTWVTETGQVSWSNELYRIFGLDPKKNAITDATIFQMAHPEDVDRIIKAYQEAISEGKPYDVEFRFYRPDGDLRYVRTIAEFVKDDNGEIVRWNGATQDVTGLKRAEEDKMKLEAQLMQSQKMEAIGRLAGGVAHDFNNLLTGIQGYSQLIFQTLREGDPLIADVKEIKAAADRAAGLTQQLLAFSRKQIIAPQILDLNKIIENSKKMLERLIGEDIALSFKPGDDVGRVKADPHQVDQVLVNLAVNSRDAMPDGGQLSIDTDNVDLDEAYCEENPDTRPGRYVMMSISDSGAGMTEETRAQIFEPFFTTKAIGKGTGLGLSTVYGIIKQNNGAISVSSEMGVGTTFKIYLPIVEGESESVDEQKEPKAVDGNETILLVEDEEMVRSLAVKILSRKGYKVIEAQNGGEAYLQCKKHGDRIDLLLTDVIMPNMTGKEVYEQLHRIHPTMKVLYMSGYTDDVIAHHGVLETETNFLQKPFTVDSLTRKIRQVLDD